jgi:hypothetical protein
VWVPKITIQSSEEKLKQSRKDSIFKRNDPAGVLWTYYFSMYLTSPGYPLPLRHFSALELYALETKSLPALIARCRFNRNTSQVVLYGPARLNGGSLRLFATEQGIAQIQYLYKHWSSTLQLNSVQRIAVSWAQFHTGVGWSIFYDVKTPLPHFSHHTGGGPGLPLS